MYGGCNDGSLETTRLLKTVLKFFLVMRISTMTKVPKITRASKFIVSKTVQYYQRRQQKTKKGNIIYTLTSQQALS